MNWQPYLDKINKILEGKGQSTLTQNESQNIVNSWQVVLSQPICAMLAQHAPEMIVPQLQRDLPNVIYDVRLKAYKKIRKTWEISPVEKVVPSKKKKGLKINKDKHKKSWQNWEKE